MSRRDYAESRYDDRDSEIYRRTRRYYDDDDRDFIPPQRYPESRQGDTPRRTETVVKERDRETVVSRARSERDRGPRQPDFLREDYGKSANAGQLVVREDKQEDDTQSRRGATRRTSVETMRASRAPAATETVERREEVTYREREGRPPYPRSERGEGEEFVFRERSRAPPQGQGQSSEEIDIKITRNEESRPPPPRSEAPAKSDQREEEVEEIRFRRGGVDRPSSGKVEKEEIVIKEDRRSPPRHRGRERLETEEIDYRGRSMPPRAVSRGPVIARKREEWIVRRPQSRPPPPAEVEKEEIIIRRKERSPSPEPPPPPAPAPPPPRREVSREEIIIKRKERSPTPDRNYEKEQIIIRRKERSPSPQPEPEPPRLEPILRPPIIQEYITHHRHIDHGFERARSPTPPPPPPSPPEEENLEIEIRRKGVRNGKAYEEDIIIEDDHRTSNSQVARRQRSASAGPRRRSRSRDRRRYDDEVAEEAEYYNRRAASRGYPGEAWNGATRDWGLVDVPPGTERVKMDGLGGASQEISWGRYDGDRRSKFVTPGRGYERDYPPPLPSQETRSERIEETRIERRITKEDGRHGRTKDKMWTEITKDLVIKEAVVESGYEFEETEDFFYVMEYLRYEDVLKLVELSEDIRRERRERLREIQWEREEMERSPKILPPPLPPMPVPPRPPVYDERYYERDYYYDREARRYR